MILDSPDFYLKFIEFVIFVVQVGQNLSVVIKSDVPSVFMVKFKFKFKFKFFIPSINP
jgi:hypothetical protein